MTSTNTGPDLCPINLHSVESWDKDLASLASISSWESFPRSWPLTSPQIIFQDIEFCWLSAASPFLGPKKVKNALERKNANQAPLTPRWLHGQRPQRSQRSLTDRCFRSTTSPWLRGTTRWQWRSSSPCPLAPPPNPWTRHRAPSLGLPGK